MKKALVLASMLAVSFSSSVFAAGDLKEIPCDKDYFTSNWCEQCFDGGSKKIGEQITWFYDKWNNPTDTQQIIYEEEQTMPSLINLGGNGTEWLQNPQDPKDFWKFASDIKWAELSVDTTSTWSTSSWTTSSPKMTGKSFYLEEGKSVTFLEAAMWASQSITKSDKKLGDPVGLLKYTINYHDIDEYGNPGTLKTHDECVAYYLGSQATPVAKVEPKPEPKQVTQVKTGPEMYVLFLLAMWLSIAYIRIRKTQK